MGKTTLIKRKTTLKNKLKLLLEGATALTCTGQGCVWMHSTKSPLLVEVGFMLAVGGYAISQKMVHDQGFTEEELRQIFEDSSRSTPEDQAPDKPAADKDAEQKEKS